MITVAFSTQVLAGQDPRSLSLRARAMQPWELLQEVSTQIDAIRPGALPERFIRSTGPTQRIWDDTDLLLLLRWLMHLDHAAPSPAPQQSKLLHVEQPYTQLAPRKAQSGHRAGGGVVWLDERCVSPIEHASEECPAALPRGQDWEDPPCIRSPHASFLKSARASFLESAREAPAQMPLEGHERDAGGPAAAERRAGDGDDAAAEDARQERDAQEAWRQRVSRVLGDTREPRPTAQQAATAKAAARKASGPSRTSRPGLGELLGCTCSYCRSLSLPRSTPRVLARRLTRPRNASRQAMEEARVDAALLEWLSRALGPSGVHLEPPALQEEGQMPAVGGDTRAEGLGAALADGRLLCALAEQLTGCEIKGRQARECRAAPRRTSSASHVRVRSLGAAAANARAGA